MLRITVLLVLFCCANSKLFTNVYPKLVQYYYRCDEDTKPLFLTPLIEAGRIREAQLASITNHSDMQGVIGHSGYFTVNKLYNSNLFFWFFANHNYRNEPIVLWLQGGPGASSLFGLFAENGPFTFKNGNLMLRKYSWLQSHSLIYIDNPVGTGYSFTNGGYAQNEASVGRDLYEALVQFFKLFPELTQNEFYITGESYAGKYVPALAYTILKSNPTADVKINLQGLAIGNGYSDPINQLNYGDYLYQIGLLDRIERSRFSTMEDLGIASIKSKNWRKAYDIFNNLLDGDGLNSSLFKNFTGFENYYNFLMPKEVDLNGQDFAKFIQRCDVRQAIHVGNEIYNVENLEVEKHLMEDVPQSVAPLISELLDHYRILIYNGQLDIIVAYPLTENYLYNLNFGSSAQFREARKKMWYVGGELAGYIKTAGNLSFALVRNAGHMVPADQPKYAYDLITRFTHRKSLT